MVHTERASAHEALKSARSLPQNLAFRVKNVFHRVLPHM